MLVERDDRVGVVLMNRPKQLNALSGELMGAVVEALVQLGQEFECARRKDFVGAANARGLGGNRGKVQHVAHCSTGSTQIE